MKSKLSLLVAINLSASVCVGSAEVRVRFSPEATPHATTFFRSTPSTIGKLTWNSVPEKGYIIEGRSSFAASTVWSTFSLDSGVADMTRRSVMMLENMGFYQVFQAPEFAVGQTVPWAITLTNLPAGHTPQQYTARLSFSDGTSYLVTGSTITAPIYKVYDYMGRKTVQVVASHPSGVRVTNSWAVTITNSTANMFVNGDLEIGTTMPANWVTGGFKTNSRSFHYPVAGYNGSSKAAQVVISNYVNGDAKWIPESVTVQAGAKYHYDAWYDSTVSPNFTIQYTHTNGTNSYPGLAIPPHATGWQRLERFVELRPRRSPLTRQSL